MTDLVGRNILITGASQGLGKALAQAYVAAGAQVVLCARNAETLAATRAEIAAGATAQQRVLALPCDVANEAQVQHLVEYALQELGAIHVLVNNAGVYGPFGAIETVDWHEWMQALEINLYGAILPTRALLPHLKQRGAGKIIFLSGGGATNPLPHISAYAASKAAVVRFAETLALEVQSFGIDVNSVAPGALNTRLMDQVIAAGADVVGKDFHARMVKIQAEGGTPLEVGAALCVFLASSASDGITGKLLSAVWDDWANLPQHIDALRGDIYTLRRIVPKDRGEPWGEVQK
jgi:3-oxoacyl-[acyl-carrier protein] reductase